MPTVGGPSGCAKNWQLRSEENRVKNASFRRKCLDKASRSEKEVVWVGMELPTFEFIR